MTNTAGFDPQHDARFQRGYDPQAAPPDGSANAAGPAGPLGLGVGVGTPTDAPYGSRAAARAAATADAAAAAEAADPRREPDREAELLADLRAEAAASVGGVAGEPAVDFVRGTIGAADLADLPPAPRRNPFVVALWILAPVLLIGGFALIVQSSSTNGYSYSGGEVPLAMVLQQLAWALAPVMLSIGLATIVGLLFWHAFAWHRGHGTADAVQ